MRYVSLKTARFGLQLTGIFITFRNSCNINIKRFNRSVVIFVRIEILNFMVTVSHCTFHIHTIYSYLN